MNNDEMEAVFNAMQLEHAGEAADEDSFRRGVWREIRHRKALGHSNERKNLRDTWIANFPALFPKLAFAGLTLAVGVAWTTASLTGKRCEPDGGSVATHMLDLNVFSPHQEGLADAKLIVNR